MFSLAERTATIAAKKELRQHGRTLAAKGKGTPLTPEEQAFVKAAKKIKSQPWWFSNKLADFAQRRAASAALRGTPESFAAIANKEAARAAKEADKLKVKAEIRAAAAKRKPSLYRDVMDYFSRTKANRAKALATKTAERVKFFDFIQSNPATARRLLSEAGTIADDATPEELARSFRFLLSGNPRTAERIMFSGGDLVAFHKFIADDLDGATRIFMERMPNLGAPTSKQLTQVFDDIYFNNRKLARIFMNRRDKEVASFKFIQEFPKDASRIMATVTGKSFDNTVPELERYFKTLLGGQPSDVKLADTITKMFLNKRINHSAAFQSGIIE